jgi:hypothetical protein
MEQRPLRLGDIVDDYCPRERRITNHAIVALVGETIKQTRCTTCDHEHVYKEAREPRRRKKDATSALYSQVLSGLQKTVPHAADDEPESEMEMEMDADDAADADVDSIEAADDTVEISAEPAPMQASAPEAAPVSEPALGEDEDENDPPQPQSNESEIWPMHRRLIRAQLPRTGNEPPAPRPIPEFTVRQPGARGQRQWGRGGGGQANGNGNHGNGRNRGGQGFGGGGGRGRGFAPPRPDGRGGPGGGRPGGGRGRRSR